MSDSEDFSNTGTKLYSQFIHKSRYARWLPEEKRRETWEETVDRYINFFCEKFPEHAKEIKKTRPYILDCSTMPSMRALMTAGKALNRDAVAGYNCSYITIDHPRAFDEMMYILMCGTGVGFSVERQYVNKLPDVAEELYPTDTVIVVADSRIGWAKAFKELLSLLYAGQIPSWDLSKVREAGAPLKIFGGRASGPEPLDELFNFTVDLFKRATGRKLSSIECHDLCCKIAEIVIVGGVRRCLPEGARVQTTRGMIPIESIVVGDEVVCGGRTAAIVEHVESGYQDLLTIVHENGQFSVTENHEIAVFAEDLGPKPAIVFKRAKELTTSDCVVWDLVGTEGRDQKVPEVKNSDHFNAKEVKTPPLTGLLCWLIGMVQGDGHISSSSIEITVDEKDAHMCEVLCSAFEAHFGLNANISQGNGNCKRVRVHSVALANWFRLHVKRANTPFEVPDFIMNSSVSNRFAYLAGVFDSDGRSRVDGGIEQCTTVHYDFYKSLTTLLSSLGIGSTSRFFDNSKRRSTGVNCKDFYTLNITGNTNRDNWIEGVCAFSLSNKFPADYDKSGKRSPIDFRYKSSFFGNPKGWKKEGFITRLTAIKKGFVSGQEVFVPSPIVSLQKESAKNTYDIEVAEINRFTTDGVVVHNSALLSLSNLSDDRMRLAKAGQWWMEDAHRRLANNSACYTEKPSFNVFLKEWNSLYESKSGERGFFSRPAAKRKAAQCGRRDENYDFGTNPCSEILLRANQFCNLSEVVVRVNDTVESVKEKVKVATILGTLQASLTDFRYLRSIWKKNTEEEALLGVSLTGIMDSSFFGDPNNASLPEALAELREYSVKVNKEWSKKLGINQSVSITCNKPSGCRPGDAFTSTTKGLLTLDELVDGQHSSWRDCDELGVYQDDGKVSSASKTYVNGYSPLVELTLNYNIQVESTPNHKWFVSQRYIPSKKKYVDVNDWVRADSIEENDILEFSTCSYMREEEAKLQSVDIKKLNSKINENITFPESMTPELSWLIGYFYGESCLSPHKKRVRFIDQNKEHLEKAGDIIKKYFNLDCNIHRASQNRDDWVMSKDSRFLYEWFVSNGFDKAPLCVPRKVRESSRESVIAFIAGLVDSTGSIASPSGCDYSKFVISTADDFFAKQLQDVCWAVGLGVRRSLNSKGSNLQNTKNKWLLTSCSIEGNNACDLLQKYSVKARGVENWIYKKETKSLILGKVKASRISRIAETFDIEVPENNWYYSGSVKSHNTVSQLVNSASGIHPRFSKYYIRRVRADVKDPLTAFLVNAGFPYEVDVMKDSQYVFSFPVKAPESSKVIDEVGAMDQLKLWKIYQDNWCEHKPSCTVYYTDDDFLKVGAWLWENFEDVSGISFLPQVDHVYKQAPYEAVDEDTYKALVKEMPKEIDWKALSEFEEEDHTAGSHTLSCASGVCEVVDLTSE